MKTLVDHCGGTLGLEALRTAGGKRASRAPLFLSTDDTFSPSHWQQDPHELL